MQTVGQWLEQLGLAQYAEAFERNAVDLELARELTDPDLEKLGVLALGHRKRLLKAISELNGTGSPTPTPQRVPEPPALERSVGAEAERRQLTVMFCDLVGSTELAAKLDPEQLRDLMQAYQHACREVIERYEGHVAQYLGDGLMVYFGWPRAHEDDAERAVRASLEIVNAVKCVEAPTPLQVRVGITTGPVVVGETGAGDASVPKLAVGETPNLAARLQGLAGADEIVIGPRTQRLVGAAFDCEDLGSHTLKGIGEPVRTWRVRGAAQVEGRFEASHSAQLTALVGRDSELTLLLDRWQQATDGEGQVVLLSGEPGIGKSRIVRALRERIASQPHTRMRYQCSPFHTHSALHPVIEQLQRAAGFEREDPVDRKLDKLEALLREGEGDITTSAPLIAALLSLRIDRYPPLNLSPEKQRERTLESLIGQVLSLSSKRPVLMTIEDAHWIDPTFQELLDLTLPRIAKAPVLMVLTYRPEYVHRWSAQAHVTSLTLNRLGGRASSTMIAELSGGKALPAEVLEQILAKTDGVPLFVEELTKTVLEAHLLRDAGDRYELAGPLPPLAIPSTLQDSLMARLDRLTPVKEVAQVAACIGREFSYQMLREVSPLTDALLQDALRQLTEAELIFARGLPPEATYTFKHALVQDAAYDSLLKSRRAELHGAIAAKLEARFPEIVSAQPEILAHHFTRAGLTKQGVEYWHKAGQRASQRLAYGEAIAYFQRGIELVRSLPDSPEVAALELSLQIGLGYAYLPLKGWTAPETLQAFTRAQALCKPAGESESVFVALLGLAGFYGMRGDVPVGLRMLEECMTHAQTVQSTDALVEAHWRRSWVLMCHGDLLASRRDYEEVLALYDPVVHRSHVHIYGQDPKLMALGWLPVVLEALGYPDQALARSAEAEAAARKVAHPFSECFAFHGGFFAHSLRGEPDRALAHAETLVALAKDQRFAFFETMGTVYRSFALLQSGKSGAKEIGDMEAAVAALLAMGAGEPALRVRTLLAQGLAYLSDIDAGLRQCEEGLRLVLQHGQREFESLFLRVQGDLLSMQGGDLDRAAESYHKAIEVAQSQHARSFELRAALGLARLHSRRGEYEDARAVLAPVYEWFTEGFDTRDLKEAKALLDELS